MELTSAQLAYTHEDHCWQPYMLNSCMHVRNGMHGAHARLLPMRTWMPPLVLGASSCSTVLWATLAAGLGWLGAGTERLNPPLA